MLIPFFVFCFFLIVILIISGVEINAGNNQADTGKGGGGRGGSYDSSGGRGGSYEKNTKTNTGGGRSGTY